MGCGRKAYYEDLESDNWKDRKQKLKELSENDLLDLFDKLKGDVYSLRKDMTSATRFQFRLIDRIDELVKKLP